MPQCTVFKYSLFPSPPFVRLQLSSSSTPFFPISTSLAEPKIDAKDRKGIAAEMLRKPRYTFKMSSLAAPPKTSAKKLGKARR